MPSLTGANGDITILKSFPDLTVDIADVKVSGNAPFEGVDLARIGSLTATIDIKSVFGDKIDIKRVGLIKPYIHIRVLEDGKANYDIAIASVIKMRLIHLDIL